MSEIHTNRMEVPSDNSCVNCDEPVSEFDDDYCTQCLIERVEMGRDRYRDLARRCRALFSGEGLTAQQGRVLLEMLKSSPAAHQLLVSLDKEFGEEE